MTGGSDMDAVLLPGGTINLEPADSSDEQSGGTSVDPMVVGVVVEDAAAAPAASVPAAIPGPAGPGTAHGGVSIVSAGSAIEFSGSVEGGGISAGIGDGTAP